MSKRKENTINDIISQLSENGNVEIKTICSDCIARLMQEILDIFGYAEFRVFKDEYDGLYNLRIIILK